MEWNGTVRLSHVRSILSDNIQEAAERLFARYIHSAREPVAAYTAPHEAPAGSDPLSSRVVVRSLETRLRRYGLDPGQDYTMGAKLTGLTRSELRVPVWYPLQVFNDIYLDGIEVKEDETRTLDIARSIAQKVESTFRALEQAFVTVAVRDPERSSVGDWVEGIIRGDGSMNGSTPSVVRYADPKELDVVVAAVVETNESRVGELFA